MIVNGFHRALFFVCGVGLLFLTYYHPEPKFRALDVMFAILGVGYILISIFGKEK